MRAPPPRKSWSTTARPRSSRGTATCPASHTHKPPASQFCCKRTSSFDLLASRAMRDKMDRQEIPIISRGVFSTFAVQEPRSQNHDHLTTQGQQGAERHSIAPLACRSWADKGSCRLGRRHSLSARTHSTCLRSVYALLLPSICRRSEHERKSESGRWRTAIPSCQSLSGTALLCRKPQVRTSAIQSAAAAKFDLSILPRSRRCRRGTRAAAAVRSRHARGARQPSAPA